MSNIKKANGAPFDAAKIAEAIRKASAELTGLADSLDTPEAPSATTEEHTSNLANYPDAYRKGVATGILAAASQVLKELDSTSKHTPYDIDQETLLWCEWQTMESLSALVWRFIPSPWRENLQYGMEQTKLEDIPEEWRDLMRRWAIHSAMESYVSTSFHIKAHGPAGNVRERKRLVKRLNQLGIKVED